MIYLLHGSEFFLMRERTKEIIRAHSDIPEKNIIRIEESTPPEIAEEYFRNGGLFDARRIIIGRNALAHKELNVMIKPLLKTLAPDIILILQEEKIEKETLNYLKQLKAEVHDCGALPPKALGAWIKKRANQKNIILTPKEIQNIIDREGQNLWNIEHALEQKSLGLSMQKPTPLSRPENVFHFIDLLMSRQNTRAYAMYHRMIRQGISIEDIFWKIYWQYKTLLAIASFKSTDSPVFIQKEAGIHPFVIKKSLAHLASFPLSEIKNTFGWLIFLWEENKLKTRNLASELEYFILTNSPPHEPSRLI